MKPPTARIEENELVSVHPVVRVHPETGERALYVTPGFTSHIVGLPRAESRRILELFFEQLSRPAHTVTRPEYTVRFRWAPGSVAFWDNRATAHLAPRDIGEFERRLYRITLVGDVPVGPDGVPSRALQGEAFAAA